MLLEPCGCEVEFDNGSGMYHFSFRSYCPRYRFIHTLFCQSHYCHPFLLFALFTSHAFLLFVISKIMLCRVLMTRSIA